jgi:hypothetical protein
MVGWSRRNAKERGYESYGRLIEWLDEWRDVPLDGDRRPGGGPAGLLDCQSVQKITVPFPPPFEVKVNHGRKIMLIKVSTDKTVSETAAALQAACRGQSLWRHAGS